MALTSPFLVRGITDVSDPYNFDPLLFGSCQLSGRDRYTGSSRLYAHDVAAEANTQVDSWKETPEAHIFKVDLPGLAKEDVKVQVEGGARVLQISGERKKQQETRPVDKWHLEERVQGSFLRRIRLPENANLKEGKASMENGVLTIVVPKMPKPAPKTIPVSST
ncbi:hypothetical protein GOP47_0017607 [Adiantum capillus-veneris]|uniref:SHSP domain-containing protein n=1 Tax=Adiantum capillus-veneris TaxID=13818 RepID=A0A9D4UGP2_ADICA|nr:hypothetical protein GOP47_0017607 [Adiantum capillus-veneris]